MNIKKQQKGFTLLEMLVVSAIFVMTMTAMVSIFVETNRAQKRLANSEKLQADTRYVVELMAREIRNNRIYYTGYNGNAGKDLNGQEVDYLLLKDNDDNDIIFHYNTDGDHWFVEIKRSAIDDNFYKVTPDDIQVTAMKIFITPNSDPFVIGATTDTQPLVTIALTTQSLTADLDDPKWIRYQTAISSRYYAR